MNIKNVKYLGEALDFIREHDLFSLPIGKYVIDEGNVWVNIVEKELKPQSQAKLEAHDIFTDLQIPLSAAEKFGVRERSSCTKPLERTNPSEDIVFFEDKADKIICALPGEMVFFEPDTAHAPLIGEGTIKKAIFKIRTKD